jgi:hypothetical protein
VEIVMQYLRRRPRLRHHQLDLRLVSQPLALGAAPGWSTLPDQTRRTLTSLLTRLLIAHAGSAGLEPDEPPEGDSNER